MSAYSAEVSTNSVTTDRCPPGADRDPRSPGWGFLNRTVPQRLETAASASRCSTLRTGLAAQNQRPPARQLRSTSSAASRVHAADGPARWSVGSAVAPCHHDSSNAIMNAYLRNRALEMLL